MILSIIKKRFHIIYNRKIHEILKIHLALLKKFHKNFKVTPVMLIIIKYRGLTYGRSEKKVGYL